MASAFVSPGDSYRDLLSKGSHEQSRERVLGFLPEGSSQATSRDRPASIHAVSTYLCLYHMNVACNILEPGLATQEPLLDEQLPRRQVFLGLKKDGFAFCKWPSLLLAGKDFVFQRGAFTHLEWRRMSQGL